MTALLPRPNPTALGHILAAIEDGAPPGAGLDARIHEALGWLVMRATDGRLSIRNPAGRQWLRMPTPTRCEVSAFGLMPAGWHHGVAVRDSILAWCADPSVGAADRAVAPAARYFECRGRSRAMALTRAALYAHRSIALLQATPALPALGVRSCRCGWHGPDTALRLGRCPDCERSIPGPEIQHAPA